MPSSGTPAFHTRQYTDCEGWFSPSTVQVLGIGRRSSGLAESTFTCQANLPACSLPTSQCAQAGISFISLNQRRTITRERLYALRSHTLLLRATPGPLHKVPAHKGLYHQVNGFLWQVQNFWSYFKVSGLFRIDFVPSERSEFCFTVLHRHI